MPWTVPRCVLGKITNERIQDTVSLCRIRGDPRMRLPNAAHTSRPWRIHELTRDFRLEDVGVLPTPGGPDDLPRLVHQIAAGDTPRPGAGGPARGPRSGLRQAFLHLALPAPRRVGGGDVNRTVHGV